MQRKLSDWYSGKPGSLRGQEETGQRWGLGSGVRLVKRRPDGV